MAVGPGEGVKLQPALFSDSYSALTPTTLLPENNPPGSQGTDNKECREDTGGNK